VTDIGSLSSTRWRWVICRNDLLLGNHQLMMIRSRKCFGDQIGILEFRCRPRIDVGGKADGERLQLFLAPASRNRPTRQAGVNTTGKQHTPHSTAADYGVFTTCAGWSMPRSCQSSKDSACSSARAPYSRSHQALLMSACRRFPTRIQCPGGSFSCHWSSGSSGGRLVPLP